MISGKWVFLSMLALAGVFLCPMSAVCSVESSMAAVQGKLIGVILPLAGILGIAFASLSFFAGSPNAKSHFTLALMGAVIGFGAPSIIEFIRSLIH